MCPHAATRIGATEVTQELAGLMHHIVTQMLYPGACIRAWVQQLRRAVGSARVSVLGAN